MTAVPACRDCVPVTAAAAAGSRGPRGIGKNLDMLLIDYDSEMALKQAVRLPEADAEKTPEDMKR